MAQGKRDQDYGSAIGTKAGEDKTKKEADFFSKPYLIIHDFTDDGESNGKGIGTNFLEKVDGKWKIAYLSRVHY